MCQTPRAGKDSFVPGRFAMTCCVQDIQFVGFPCKYDKVKAVSYTHLDQNGTEAHGQQQAGFHVFFNGKVDQQAAYGPHDDHAHIQLQ